MKFLFLLLAFSLIANLIAAPVYIVTFSTLLLTPIFAFFLYNFISNAVALYITSILITFALFFFICGKKQSLKPTLNEIIPLLVFVLFFVACYRLSLSWADFFPIGERLRDYALLSSVLTNPFQAIEPWMDGASLNYYLYWYRFAHFLSTFTNYQVWDTYHLMSGFAAAFLASTVFYIALNCLKFSRFFALLSSTIIVFGSNVLGVVYFKNGDQNWWGPSRIIDGLINEFPAWSFILGDIHPHYLNLGLMPFLICCFWHLTKANLEFKLKLLTLAILLTIAPLMLYNANAWDVPLYGLVVGIGLVLYLFLKVSFPRGESSNLMFEKRAALALVSLFLFWSLYSSSRNIIPGDHPFRWVSADIATSPITAVFLHWGVPLTIFIAYLILSQKKLLDALGFALAIASGFLFFEAKILISLLFALTIIKTVNEERPALRERWLLCTFSLAALALILLPEIVFLDDPYGGKSERMNTTFKVYSFAWSIVWLAAFAQLGDLLKKLPERIKGFPTIIGSLVITFILCGFSYATFEVRKNNPPTSEGLKAVNQTFPGAAAVIRTLRESPDNTVILEAQGNAYDWTGVIATLSGKTSFLGWANHINLLTRDYAEVTRRENLTRDFYENSSCEARKSLIENERISIIVVGPLERRKYGESSQNNWECFSVKMVEGEYTILSR